MGVKKKKQKNLTYEKIYHTFMSSLKFNKQERKKD